MPSTKPKPQPAAEKRPEPKPESISQKDFCRLLIASAPGVGVAALIDRFGVDPVALSNGEYTRLREYLDLTRKQGHAAPIPDAIGWLLHLSKDHPEMTRAGVLSWIATNFIQESDDESEYYGDGAGVLVGRHPREPVVLLDEREAKALDWTLRAIRIGGWFASWLITQVATVADAKRPTERCPTPLRIMGTLTLDAQEFENSIESARVMARLRPDLVTEQPAAEPPANQEPPTKAEPSEPAPVPENASKSRRAPAKPRRKAA